MSAAKALVALASGERPAHDRLLGACRCEWLGNEVYGEEAIVEMFRAAPLDLAEATAIETPMALALFARQAVLVADLYDGRIGRLWRISAGAVAVAEPAVAVAFDPDLSQSRRDVHLAPADHPELADAWIARIEDAGRRLAREAAGDGEAPAHRLRVFTSRAFAAGDRAVALFAVHRLGGGAVRTAGFGHAALLIDGDDDPLLIADAPPSRDWRPRL